MIRKGTKNILLVIAVLVLGCAVADCREATRFVRGIVRDATTNRGLPFASVRIDDSPSGAVADESGIFELSVPASAQTLNITCIGYGRRSVPLWTNPYNLYDITLVPQSTELKEVVVRKKKYSKKNNPVVDFAQRLRTAARAASPREMPYYSATVYEKTDLGLNDFNPTEGTESRLLSRFPFLTEHVDTSDVSGLPVLILSIKEKEARQHWRNGNSRTVVNAYRSEGVDEIISEDNVRVLFEDVLRHINLADDDINILQNRFVSPLSRIAPDFYKFYLADTVNVAGVPCAVLSFYPHNRASFGFNGMVYVQAGDTAMTIRRVELTKPRDINLNFIENLRITQDMHPDPVTGATVVDHEDMVMEVKVMPGTQPLYARRETYWTDHTFQDSEDARSAFATGGDEIFADSARNRSDEYWSTARTAALRPAEGRTGLLMKRLRSVPVYYYGEKVLKVLTTGYIPLTKPWDKSKWDYGPVNTTVSYNSIEGVRLRAGGMSTASFSPHWFFRGYAAWGTRDHRWKYRAEAEYSFNRKQRHSREFPIHSIRLSSQYDLNQIGQHYLFTNPDNFVLSLKRMRDNAATYEFLNRLDYTLELRNNFSVEATVASARQNADTELKFTDGYRRNFSHFTENYLRVRLRYAPGEKFVQTRSNRFPVNQDPWTLVLEQTFAPAKTFGNLYPINKTEINVSKRFWLSAFGFVDCAVGGGHVWSRTSFPDLLIPNANLSYTIQPQSFALMNPMEFINSSYVSWDVTYWLNGALFNLIPGFKKLRLRELVGIRGLYGHLADRCNPALDPTLFTLPPEVNPTGMSHGPYAELSAGLDNIFRCLRVDYVRRLTYRHPGYAVDRHGIRVALHVTF